MDSLPLVSIVVAVHNREAWVKRSLSSIAAQTYRPLQIVVVDNGSTDHSSEIVTKWMEEERRKNTRKDIDFLFLEEKRPGACVARNSGLHHSSGEWVCFFDDDDEMSPDFVERMMHTALSGSDSSVPERNFRWVLARTMMVLPDGRELVRAGWRHPSVSDQILGSFVSTQSFIAHRSLLLEIGGWDERLPCWNDYALGVSLLCFAPYPLWNEGIYHRIYQHADSITGGSFAEKFDNIVTALRAVEGMLDRNCCSSRHQNIRKALFLRCSIVQGQLVSEKRPELVVRLRSESFASGRGLSFGTKVFAWCLRRYVACGGRGAWRVALLFL